LDPFFVFQLLLFECVVGFDRELDAEGTSLFCGNLQRKIIKRCMMIGDKMTVLDID